MYLRFGTMTTDIGSERRTKRNSLLVIELIASVVFKQRKMLRSKVCLLFTGLLIDAFKQALVQFMLFWS